MLIGSSFVFKKKVSSRHCDGGGSRLVSLSFELTRCDMNLGTYILAKYVFINVYSDTQRLMAE